MKQELDKLTEDYFSNIEGNNVIYQQNNIPTIEKNKIKRKVRIPEERI